MSEIKQLKGLQIGDNIYSQIDDMIEDDPELTWSGQKIAQKANSIENKIGEGFSETNTIKQNIDLINNKIGSPPEPDEDGNNISVMDYVKQLESEISALKIQISELDDRITTLEDSNLPPETT